MAERIVYLDRKHDLVHADADCGETDGTTLRLDAARKRGYSPCPDCLSDVE